MRRTVLALKLSLKNLFGHPGRTAVSFLGIVIGITSVILVMSLGDGVKAFVISQVQSFGSDIIWVETKTPKTSKTSTQNATSMVGGSAITTFKLADAEKLAENSNVAAWYAAIMSQQIVKVGSKDKQAIVMGVTEGVIETDEQAKIEIGRAFTKDDNDALSQVAIIGSDFRKDFFAPGENPIGQKIKIKGKTFRIVGVLKERGSTGFFNFDQLIHIPLGTLQKKLMGIDYIQMASYKLKNQGEMELTALQLTDKMRDIHQIDNPDDDDFAVTSVSEATSILGGVFDAITVTLIALTSISLIVGGVGIMNVMYVAVTERTFEVGLYKSLGAKNSDILMMFLFEAIIITILGGLIGLILGIGGTVLGEIIANRFGFNLQFPISVKSFILGFGFSALVGLVFGVQPARKASLLSPAEAMRRE